MLQLCLQHAPLAPHRRHAVNESQRVRAPAFSAWTLPAFLAHRYHAPTLPYRRARDKIIYLVDKINQSCDDTRMDTTELQRLLSEHDDGILRHGQHEEGREFCALEFESRVRGRAWSDAPITLPDLRPLNDARWSSDTARTAALLPVMAALWDWTSWSTERRQAWAERVVIATVNQIISELPSLPDEIRVRCRAATDITAARAAAWASAEAAARAAESRVEGRRLREFLNASTSTAR